MDDPVARRALDDLADALPFLLARDEPHPPLWLSPRFCDEVAATRSRLVALAHPRRLLAAIEAPDDGPQPPSAPGRFEVAARRLGRDARSVAVAIRWLEIRSARRLPGWVDLLRQRGLDAHGAAIPERAGLDASLWFG